jgi:hypothetical protein
MTAIVIEVTAGEVARRGIGSDERVMLAIAPTRELIPGRRESRARVVAAGMTDADIDRLIKDAKSEVGKYLRRRIVADTKILAETRMA